MTKDEKATQSTATGARYPTVGFQTGGVGRSALGHPPHPYETFAYDVALFAAGIQDFNIVAYSSVLPKDLAIISKEDAQPHFYHGAVLEVIMAGVGATYSEGPGKRNVGIRRHGQHYVIDSAGPVMAIAACVGQLTDVKDQVGNTVGGYMAEYVGIFEAPIGQMAAAQQATQQIEESFNHMLALRNYAEVNRKIYETTYIEVTEDEPHGYALSAMGFLTFGNAPIA